MVRFEKLTIPETIYPFVDAVVADDYTNGTFGNVEDGVFTAGAGDFCIMQVEKGNYAYTDEFTIYADEHARVADMTLGEGLVINITANELPSSYEVGDVLEADSNGALDVAEGGAGYRIIELMDYGVRAVVELTEQA